MKLDLDRRAQRQFTVEITGSVDVSLGEGCPESAQLAGTLEVLDIESRVLVKGVLAAQGTAECGRCLKEFTMAWSVPAELMILRQADNDEDQGEMPVIVQRQGEVDLRASIREFAVLSYPQRRICKEDCRGLCATCGADLNQDTCSCEHEDTDPRWDALPD